MNEYTLDQQIASLKREVAMRKNVYAKWVSLGKMRQGEADHELGAMTAALHTLLNLKDGGTNETEQRHSDSRGTADHR